MAEGSSVRQDDVVCRYFLTSTCRDGDRCLFSHDRTRRIPDSVCRYYLQGICAYGQNCRFDHVIVSNDATPKPNTYNDRHIAGPSRRSANRDAPTNFSRIDTNKRNTHQPRFSALTRNTPKNESNHHLNAPGPTSNWINAPEFVPKQTRSYADTVKANTNTVINNEPEKFSDELCPLYVEGECPFEDKCRFVHGTVCELCHKACLHPRNEDQRKSHIELCEKELEQEMEFSFAIQRSMDKTCGICMDIVLEKEPISERRFGILEKCNHVYCLTCIRKWRRSRQFENSQHIDNALDPVVTRACPECRIASDFITPSVYFVDNEEEKTKLITEYKKALSKKPCKYFKQGEGTCPFGGACFYLHAKPDGTKVELPLPTRRRRQNQDGELDYMGRIFLWDYLEYREENVLINVDLADLMFSWSDTDDDASDISDSFFLSESF